VTQAAEAVCSRDCIHWLSVTAVRPSWGTPAGRLVHGELHRRSRLYGPGREHGGLPHSFHRPPADADSGRAGRRGEGRRAAHPPSSATRRPRAPWPRRPHARRGDGDPGRGRRVPGRRVRAAGLRHRQGEHAGLGYAAVLRGRRRGDRPELQQRRAVGARAPQRPDHDVHLPPGLGPLGTAGGTA